MTPKSVFEEIANRFSDPEQVEKAQELGAVYQFNISGDDGGSWVIDLKAPKVEEGTNEDADCTINIADSDFVGLVKGDIPGQQLFFQGKLQIAGNMGLALKLDQVLKA